MKTTGLNLVPQRQARLIHGRPIPCHSIILHIPNPIPTQRNPMQRMHGVLNNPLNLQPTSKSAKRTLAKGRAAGGRHLKEPLEPPHLEHALADQHAELEDAPPLDARVGRLGGVAVRALAHHDVALLVFDLGEEFGHLADWRGWLWVSWV